ncbi:MAG TPA: hypothetical protein DCE71_01330, partial [Parachlamydiales bacterium]|nr:hypothetical protein [Parachlamydiales bacterium]
MDFICSLDMDPEKTPPGIGAFLLVSIQNKLDAVSRTMAEIQSEHERAVQGVHAAERLLAQASSAADQSRFKSELYAQVHTANSLSSRMEEERKIALWLSQFFSHFLNEATEKLQEAFQEVFDSSLNTGEAERFEDSPAGFRLLYKSGRSAAASWERIEEASQFVHAVYKFFESLEGRYFVDLPMKSQFTQIMTELLQYIRSEAFISGALVRAKENKKAKSATPWAYQSGAVMQNLVQSYYDLPEKPNEFSRNIRTPLELHEFLREAAKKNGGKTSLMHSPTHGFLFHPSLMGPEDALNNGLRFVKSLFVSSDQTEFLIERLSLYLPFDVRPLFHSGCRQNLRSEN